MKKYTNEQLSRILSAAANCELGKVTFFIKPGAKNMLCIEQAARASYSSDGNWDAYRVNTYDNLIYAKKGYAKITRTPGNMLRWLEEKKMA